MCEKNEFEIERMKLFSGFQVLKWLIKKICLLTLSLYVWVCLFSVLGEKLPTRALLPYLLVKEKYQMSNTK